MNILKNKHMILAMFVAPALAIIAYFLVDNMVSEKPKTAQQGMVYKLAAKSNCRYQSGVCTLQNADVSVQISAQRINKKEIRLTMVSDFPINQIIMSSIIDGVESVPTALKKVLGKVNSWSAIMVLEWPEKQVLHFAVNIADIMYYAETSAIFVDYETLFSRENFSEH